MIIGQTNITKSVNDKNFKTTKTFFYEINFKTSRHQNDLEKTEKGRYEAQIAPQ